MPDYGSLVGSTNGANKLINTFFEQIENDKRKGWKALLSHRYLLLGFWVGSGCI